MQAAKINWDGKCLRRSSGLTMPGRCGLVLYIKVITLLFVNFVWDLYFSRRVICTFILSLSGQMAVLKNTKSRDLIQEMWDHEKAHLAKFEELLVEYQVSFKGSKTTLSLKWKCQISSCSRMYDQQCWFQFGSLRGSPWGRVAPCWGRRGQWPAQLRLVAIYFLHWKSIQVLYFWKSWSQKREILFPCPGGGPGDEALRRPGDRDGGEQPQAGREPDRGDQE